MLTIQKRPQALLLLAITCLAGASVVNGQTTSHGWSETAAPKAVVGDSAADTLQVDEDGLALYPRWNKLFPPLTVLDPGTTLTVMRDRGGWKQVGVDTTSETGWVFCETVPVVSEGSALSLPLAASPTTSGLVTKGWSPAAHARGRIDADPALVEELLRRTVDHAGYLVFLAQDPPPDGLDGAADPEVEPQPTAEPVQANPWDAGAGDAMDALDRALNTTPDETERQLRKKGSDFGHQRLDVPLAESLTELDEIALGTAATARLLHETPALAGGPLTSYVAFVGLRLVETLPGDRSVWRFAVLDTDTINAFSLPGGFVFVTRGALENCANEAQLAALLAHEIAHVVLRHAVISLDKDLLEVLRNAARSEMDELLGNDEETQQLIDQLDQVGDDLYALSQAPFSQELESEADRLALQLMVRAGYDPREGLALLQQLTTLRLMDDLLSSHPPIGERLEVVEQELLELPADGSVGTERFEQAMKALDAAVESDG